MQQRMHLFTGLNQLLKQEEKNFLKSFLILCTSVYKWHIWFPLGIFPKENERKRDNKGEISLTLNPGIIIKGWFGGWFFSELQV